MRDFPIFTTEFGVSSLILKEIPYKNEAYIRIRDVQEEAYEDHLRECVSFCRMAGTEHILAAGHGKLSAYPLYVTLYEMRGTARVEEENLVNLFPVTEQTVARWRQICNERMRAVPCAATQTSREEADILKGGAYFIHREGKLLGIGWLRDGEILAVAAVEPGMGRTVLNTLLSLAEGEPVHLEVASTNERAIRMYESMGFVKTAEKTRWYDVGQPTQK